CPKLYWGTAEQTQNPSAAGDPPSQSLLPAVPRSALPLPGEVFD
ncbi:hypothetical protein Pfo_003190, partial [Paulownia fortunei]